MSFNDIREDLDENIDLASEFPKRKIKTSKLHSLNTNDIVNDLPEKQRALHLESINDTLFGSFNTIMNQYDRTGFDSGLDTENTFFFLNSAKQKLNCN